MFATKPFGSNMLLLAALTVLVAVLANVASAGYSEVCLNKGRGCIDYQVTKDCCAAVGGQQHFDERDHICKSNNLCGGNSVNIGKMVSCCESRGAGSRELKYGGNCLPKDVPGKC